MTSCSSDPLFFNDLLVCGDNYPTLGKNSKHTVILHLELNFRHSVSYRGGVCHNRDRERVWIPALSNGGISRNPSGRGLPQHHCVFPLLLVLVCFRWNFWMFWSFGIQNKRCSCTYSSWVTGCLFIFLICGRLFITPFAREVFAYVWLLRTINQQHMLCNSIQRSER